MLLHCGNVILLGNPVGKDQSTVNDESLEGLKFGESAKKSIWRKKVWRISPCDQ